MEMIFKGVLKSSGFCDALFLNHCTNFKQILSE